MLEAFKQRNLSEGCAGDPVIAIFQLNFLDGHSLKTVLVLKAAYLARMRVNCLINDSVSPTADLFLTKVAVPSCVAPWRQGG